MFLKKNLRQRECLRNVYARSLCISKGFSVHVSKLRCESRKIIVNKSPTPTLAQFFSVYSLGHWVQLKSLYSVVDCAWIESSCTPIAMRNIAQNFAAQFLNFLRNSYGKGFDNFQVLPNFEIMSDRFQWSFLICRRGYHSKPLPFA